MKALAQEVVATFSRRLQPLGLSVRELTGSCWWLVARGSSVSDVAAVAGDMQLTRREIAATQACVERMGGARCSCLARRLLIYIIDLCLYIIGLDFPFCPKDTEQVKRLIIYLLSRVLMSLLMVGA